MNILIFLLFFTPTPPPPTVPWATLTPFPTASASEAPIVMPLGNTEFEIVAQRAVQVYNAIPVNIQDLIMGFLIFVLVIGLFMLIAGEFNDT